MTITDHTNRPNSAPPPQIKTVLTTMLAILQLQNGAGGEPVLSGSNEPDWRLRQRLIAADESPDVLLHLQRPTVIHWSILDHSLLGHLHCTLVVLTHKPNFGPWHASVPLPN